MPNVCGVGRSRYNRFTYLAASRNGDRPLAWGWVVQSLWTRVGPGTPLLPAPMSLAWQQLAKVQPTGQVNPENTEEVDKPTLLASITTLSLHCVI